MIFLFISASCASSQEVLSIRIPESVKVASNSFALSQVAEITGPKDVARTAGWIRFSTDGTLTRKAVIEALQQSGIAGVKVELRMPEVVLIRARTANDLPAKQMESNRGVVIKKGTKVTIFVAVNGILVETRGEAQQSGSVGDSIRVRNMESKKIVTAIIRDANRVEVQI